MVDAHFHLNCLTIRTQIWTLCPGSFSLASKKRLSGHETGQNVRIAGLFDTKSAFLDGNKGLNQR